MSKKLPAAAGKSVDSLSKEELVQLGEDTIHSIKALRARWVGLVRLNDKQRENHQGRLLGPQIPALTALFDTLLPHEHDDDKTAKKRAQLASHFDAFGEKDGGVDPEKFEVELLQRRLHRIAVQQKLAEELSAMGRLLADDVLHTSEMLRLAGQSAFDMTHTLAAGNSTYAQLLAPVQNALRDMTKAARNRLAQIREEADSAAAAATTQGIEASETPAPNKG